MPYRIPHMPLDTSPDVSHLAVTSLAALLELGMRVLTSAVELSPIASPLIADTLDTKNMARGAEARSRAKLERPRKLLAEEVEPGTNIIVTNQWVLIDKFLKAVVDVARPFDLAALPRCVRKLLARDPAEALVLCVSSRMIT